MKKITLNLTITLFLISTNLIFADYWTQKADFTTGRLMPGSFVIGHNAYVGLGSDGYPVYHFPNDFWKYDQNTNTWTQLASFIGTPVYGPIGFAIGGKGYFGCGWTPTFYNQFYEYDTLTNNWAVKNNFSGMNRTDAVCQTINNKGYVGLGLGTGNTNLNDMWEYNNITDTWTQKANFPATARYGTCQLAIDGKIYTGLGNDAVYPNSNPRNDFYMFDPVANTWTMKTSFPGVARWALTSFVIDHKGYIGAGYDATNDRKDFWKYDPNVDQWWQVATFDTTGVREAASFGMGFKGYVICGYDPAYGGPAKLFWEYTPDSLSGINEESQTIFNISLYPNPSNGNFKVNYSASKNASLDLKVTDINGRIIVSEIKNQTVGVNEFSFDLSSAARGVYFVELISDNNHLTKKIVLE